LPPDIGSAMQFTIHHDVQVARHLGDRPTGTYLGRIMKEGSTKTIFPAPGRPYTRALISATPKLSQAQRTQAPVA
jgi:ABC-type oligopeptide transport system ATPase subunit